MRFQSSLFHQSTRRKFANLLIRKFAKWRTVNHLFLEGFKPEFQVTNNKIHLSYASANKFKK